MNPNEYQRSAARTECDQVASLKRMCDNRLIVPAATEAGNDDPSLKAIRLNHCCLGLTKQTGEIIKQLQRWIYYGGSLDVDNLVEEFGDVLWYVAEGLNSLGLDMGQVMAANDAKLRARYPDKFTSEHALNRDVRAEAEAMTRSMSVEDVLPPGGLEQDGHGYGHHPDAPK